VALSSKPAPKETPKNAEFHQYLRSLFPEGTHGYVKLEDVVLKPKPSNPSKFDWTDQKSPTFKLPGEWPNLLEYVRNHSENNPERDLYVCTQLLRGKRRIKENAKALRVAWAEFDTGEDLPNDIPEPSMVVESSPGHFHAYWFLSKDTDPFEVEALNKRIAYAFTADKGGWDLSQVLRVPGTRNNKYGGSPRVTLKKLDGSLVYDFQELLHTVPELEAPSKNGQAKSHAPQGDADGKPPVES
jgi:RepB DNA-primase from phage plasmid